MRNNLSKKSQNFRFDDSENAEVLQTCYSNNYIVINPIVDWSEKDVYSFLESVGIKKQQLNPLYSQGQCRVGCIGCPISSRQKDELNRYPKYKQAYIRTAQKILDKLKNSNKQLPFKNGEQFIDWWCSNYSIKDWERINELMENQISLF